MIPPPKSIDLKPEEGNLDILHEDKDLIVLFKPAGIVVHPSAGHETGTLVHFLLGHCKDLSGIGGATRPGIVHRLDKDTSGVMVSAKNDKTHQHLAKQFKDHSVRRSYQALVWGKLMQKKGTIDAPLGRHPINRKKITIISNGKRAITHWKLENQFCTISLLKCKLETGRTHQIRVHLSSRGFPIIGDPLYGKFPRSLLKALSNPLKDALKQFKRQALHAFELGFYHPGRGEILDFSHPPPEDFKNLLHLITREE
jgi:23S rRNA pseudouridine1911/1915/1917 synthase